MWLLQFPGNLYYFLLNRGENSKIFPEIYCLRRMLSHFPFSYNAASGIILECRRDGNVCYFMYLVRILQDK